MTHRQTENKTQFLPPYFNLLFFFSSDDNMWRSHDPFASLGNWRLYSHFMLQMQSCFINYTVQSPITQFLFTNLFSLLFDRAWLNMTHFGDKGNGFFCLTHLLPYSLVPVNTTPKQNEGELKGEQVDVYLDKCYHKMAFSGLLEAGLLWVYLWLFFQYLPFKCLLPPNL